MMNQLLTKKTCILSIMMVAGLSLVWLIPNSGVFQSSRLMEKLPEELLDRVGVDLEISSKERETLAADTTFARKRYFQNLAEGADPAVDVSVVFSGKDINNSIHRPEVCLKAQGWKFLSEKYVTIEAGGEIIPFKEIICARPRVATDKMADKNSKGETIVDKRIQYYTFIGAEKIVAGHYERTWEDMKMRVGKGSDQQWAYITFSMNVTLNPTDDAKDAGYYKSLDIDQTRVVMKQFKVAALPLLLEK